MGDVVDFQAERGKRFLARVSELEAAGHVPAAAMCIAMHEFGISDDGFEWRMQCTITSDAPMCSCKIRLPENDDGD